jgi:hypothetical protein
MLCRGSCGRDVKYLWRRWRGEEVRFWGETCNDDEEDNGRGFLGNGELVLSFHPMLEPLS